MDDYIEYQRFLSFDDASVLTELLEANNIPYIVDDSALHYGLVPPSGNPMDNQLIVKIKESDFEKVEFLTGNLVKDPDDEEDFLHTFTDEQILDIIANPGEWDNSVIELANKIIKERISKLPAENITTDDIPPVDEEHFSHSFTDEQILDIIADPSKWDSSVIELANRIIKERKLKLPAENELPIEKELSVEKEPLVENITPPVKPLDEEPDNSTLKYSTSAYTISIYLVFFVSALFKVLNTSDEFLSLINCLFIILAVAFLTQILITRTYILTSDELQCRTRFAGIIVKEINIKLKDIKDISHKPFSFWHGFSSHYKISYENMGMPEGYYIGALSNTYLNKLVGKIRTRKEFIRKKTRVYSPNLIYQQNTVNCRMKLVVLSNYGSEEKIISDNANSTQINETMNSLNWNDFHQVCLQKENGDYIEVGGNLKEDGLSVIYEENRHQHVIDDPPKTVEPMTAILLSYLAGDNKFKIENRFS